MPSQNDYVGTPDDGYADARYLRETPYNSISAWSAAMLEAVPESDRCPICEGRGRVVIRASNGGIGETPVCPTCLGTRRKGTTW